MTECHCQPTTNPFCPGFECKNNNFKTIKQKETTMIIIKQSIAM